MNLREWALIAFTILAQMAVGSFLILGVVHYFAQRREGIQQADRLSDRALVAIGPVLVIGLIVSFLHLGNPINAFRAISNVGASWLSREILFGVLFAAAGAIFAFMQWRKISSPATRSAIAWLAALLGVVMVYSMSNVYQIESMPSWNTPLTTVAFFTTTLLLGALAMGTAFVANYFYLLQRDPECAEIQCRLVHAAMRGIAVGSLVLLGIEVVVVPFQLAALSSGADAALATAQLYDQYGIVLVLRIALAFIGAGILAMFLYRYATIEGREKMRVVSNLTYAAFAFVLVAEVIGRFLFYATHVRIGI